MIGDWKNSETELPESNDRYQSYIVCDWKGNVTLANYQERDGNLSFYPMHGKKEFPAKYWMELPKPPIGIEVDRLNKRLKELNEQKKSIQADIDGVKADLYFISQKRRGESHE